MKPTRVEHRYDVGDILTGPHVEKSVSFILVGPPDSTTEEWLTLFDQSIAEIRRTFEEVA